MKQLLFSGTCTAMVTPFLNGQVNYPMMEQLLKKQIDAGIEAVVIAGTTGEAPTLSDREKLTLFARCKAYAGDSLKIICGTGSNDTKHAQELSLAAQEAGADALLIGRHLSRHTSLNVAYCCICHTATSLCFLRCFSFALRLVFGFRNVGELVTRRQIFLYPALRDKHFSAEVLVDHFYHYGVTVSLLKQLVSARNPISISALTANIFCWNRLIVVLPLTSVASLE